MRKIGKTGSTHFRVWFTYFAPGHNMDGGMHAKGEVMSNLNMVI